MIPQKYKCMLGLHPDEAIKTLDDNLYYYSEGCTECNRIVTARDYT